MMALDVSKLVKHLAGALSVATCLLIGCAKSSTPKPSTSPPLPTSQASANTDKYTVTFSAKARFVFERAGDEWIYFDDHQGEGAQNRKVNELCEQTPTGERLSDRGVFVSVTVHEPTAKANAAPVSVPITVAATYDDTGQQATHQGTIGLSAQGALICQHDDNR